MIEAQHTETNQSTFREEKKLSLSTKLCPWQDAHKEFAQPTRLSPALNKIDRVRLKELTGIDVANELNVLIDMIEDACTRGRIRNMQVELPDGVISTLYDLNTFQGEFDEYVNQLVKENRLADIKQKRQARNWLKPKQEIKRTLWDQMVTQPRFLRFLERKCRQPEDYYQICRNAPFDPVQRRNEILGLLQFLVKAKPYRILEIGTARGGTLYLWTTIAKANAKLATIDLRIPTPDLLRSFARKQQKIELFEGDSTTSIIQSKVRAAFPEGLDFLFIDGDHSYTGVKSDFENYSSLVRPGGFIGFHDIVPDYHHRFNIVTGAYAGGVPQFWKEINSDFESVEFVNHPNQDGAGIGVLLIR